MPKLAINDAISLFDKPSQLLKCRGSSFTQIAHKKINMKFGWISCTVNIYNRKEKHEPVYMVMRTMGKSCVVTFIEHQ